MLVVDKQVINFPVISPRQNTTLVKSFVNYNPSLFHSRLGCRLIFTEWHDQRGPVLLVLLENDSHLAIFACNRVQLGPVAVQDKITKLHKLWSTLEKLFSP